MLSASFFLQVVSLIVLIVCCTVQLLVNSVLHIYLVLPIMYFCIRVSEKQC